MIQAVRYWIPLIALLAGCTFNLGNVRPQAGRTADQQQLDTLTCKDQAHLTTESTGHQTAYFLLGATIVGAPAALVIDRKVQRKAFADCMTAKGYTVTSAGSSLASDASSPVQP
jgi:hypothetical protein